MANLLESVLKGQGGGEYKNMAKEKYLILSERLFLMNDLDVTKNCLNILTKVVDNIIESNGDEPKYLCLKLSSVTVSRRIVGVSGGQEFLYALGFSKVRDTKSFAFILEKKDVDLEHLKKCKEWIYNHDRNSNRNDGFIVVQIRQLNGRALIAPFYMKETIQDIYDFVLNFRTDGGRSEFILCAYPVVEYKTPEQLNLPISALCSKSNNDHGGSGGYSKKINLMIKKSNISNDNAFLNGGENANVTAFNEQLKLQQAISDRRASRIEEEKQRKQDRKKAINAFKEDREDTQLKEHRRRVANENRLKSEMERIDKYHQSLLENDTNKNTNGDT